MRISLTGVLIIGFALLLAGPALGTTYIYDDITEDVIWDPSNSPFCIMDDINIVDGAELRIWPGVEIVLFPGTDPPPERSSLNVVNGCITALGGEYDPILFRCDADFGTMQIGHENYVTDLEYCNFDAFRNIDVIGKVNINWCNFEDSLDAGLVFLYTPLNKIWLKHNTFSGCFRGVSLLHSEGSSPARNWGFEDCWFEGTYGAFLGGTTDKPPVDFKYCVFLHNGIDAVSESPVPSSLDIQFWVEDCYFSGDSTGYGIESHQVSFCVENSTFLYLGRALDLEGIMPPDGFNKMWVLDCYISNCGGGRDLPPRGAITLETGHRIKLRGTTVRDSTGEHGIYFGYNVPDWGGDLGTESDHGYNIIQNNGESEYGTWDIFAGGWIDRPGIIPAVGNTWDHASELEVALYDIWDALDDPQHCFLIVWLGDLDSTSAPPNTAVREHLPSREYLLTPEYSATPYISESPSHFSMNPNKHGKENLGSYNSAAEVKSRPGNLSNYDKNWLNQIYRQVSRANRLLARFPQSKGLRVPYPVLSEPLKPAATIEKSSLGKIKALYR